MKNAQIILRQLKNHLIQNLGDSVKDVILFGSRIRDKTSDDSDYDVLILLDRDYTGSDENTILDLCYDIDLKFDILLDVHLLSMKELSSKRGRQPIYRNAVESGIYAA
jgi:uncharacterized protein